MIAPSLYAIAGNAAMVLNLASFWMADVRKLRWLAIAASLSFVAYSMLVPGGPLWIMLGWSVAFIAINAYRLAGGHSVAAKQARSIVGETAPKEGPSL